MPKALYKTISDDDSGIGSGTTATNGDHTIIDTTHSNLYKSVVLQPAHLFECIIKNNDPKSVLTWDFDVVTSDLHFTVFRTTKSVTCVNGKKSNLIVPTMNCYYLTAVYSQNRCVSVGVRYGRYGRR